MTKEGRVQRAALLLQLFLLHLLRLLLVRLIDPEK
jgi:hypothetical protein